MGSVLRTFFVLLALSAAFSCVLAKDVDAKSARRRLDAVFSKSDPKLREKELRKLEGDTLDEAAAGEARAHALTLQRRAPKKLPKLEEAHEGAFNYEYQVRAGNTTYTNFALLDLPADISVDKPAPLVVGLHSDLGTAWLELSALRASSREVPGLRECIRACPQALNRGNTTDDPRNNPPGLREYFGWGPKRAGIDTVFNLLDQLIAEFNIDRDRIYLVGAAGMGGEAAFHLAQLRPSQFAALCVRDCLPPRWYPDLAATTDLEELRKAGTLGEQKVEFGWLECYRNTPVYWLHADDDKKYPTAHARQARDAMKAAEVPLEYQEYSGGHATGSTATLSKALQGCIGVKRNPLPVTITARGVRHDSASLGNDRNYWVEISSQEYPGRKGDWPYRILAGGKVTVTAGKADNTLTINSDGVSRVTVYLTDELLQLDREIKLVVNGEQRTVTVTRELKLLARTASDNADSGEAWTASLTIDS